MPYLIVQRRVMKSCKVTHEWNGYKRVLSFNTIFMMFRKVTSEHSKTKRSIYDRLM